MSIKTWQTSLGHDRPLLACGAVGEAMQDEIDELRAALEACELELAQITCLLSKNEDFEKTIAERDAEIERLTAMPYISETARAVAYGKKIDAQRKVLDQALEALENGPSTFHTYPDKSECRCSQCQFVRLRKAAITAIQEVL